MLIFETVCACFIIILFCQISTQCLYVLYIHLFIYVCKYIRQTEINMEKKQTNKTILVLFCFLLSFDTCRSEELPYSSWLSVAFDCFTAGRLIYCLLSVPQREVSALKSRPCKSLGKQIYL